MRIDGLNVFVQLTSQVCELRPDPMQTQQLRCKAELCGKSNQFRKRDLIFFCAGVRIAGFNHTQR